MLQDLDKTIEKILVENGKINKREIDIAFDEHQLAEIIERHLAENSSIEYDELEIINPRTVSFRVK